MPASIISKTILNKKKRRDEWFLDDYTVNPYSGCSFNCLFCYIRGSKYGEHMENKLSVKDNAVELLDKQLALRAKKKQYGFIVLSSATDPYLQFEKELKLTRKLLEVILKHRFPVHIVTRSGLVTRDFDLLKEINEQAILPPILNDKLRQKVLISFSFSTLDETVTRIFEPGAPLPAERMDALKAAIQAGFTCGVNLMPLLPYITDTGENLDYMYKTFHESGVQHLYASSVTLFGNGPADSKTLLLRAVEKQYPHLKEKYEKFFLFSNEMPGYYQSALRKKTTALGNTYHLKNSYI